MAHLWIRAEERANEARVPVTPSGVLELINAGLTVTVEDSPARVFVTEDYNAAGAQVVKAGTWRSAPDDVIILGLKELVADANPLRHRHVMFGHAYKEQAEGAVLLNRFRAGGGTLLDVESLTDGKGRRVAAFGYWAGFAGAALTVQAFAAQKTGARFGPVSVSPSADALVHHTKTALGKVRPSGLIIGAMGRVGGGARALLEALDLSATLWDQAETAHGGPFPQVADHDLCLNCVVALPNTPVFVPLEMKTTPRRLRVIGDIACDPTSDYNPVKPNDRLTDWQNPARRVAKTPPLDVIAIDNLPSLLPRESSEDFAAQLLPHLLQIDTDPEGVWARADALFRTHMAVEQAPKDRDR